MPRSSPHASRVGRGKKKEEGNGNVFQAQGDAGAGTDVWEGKEEAAGVRADPFPGSFGGGSKDGKGGSSGTAAPGGLGAHGDTAAPRGCGGCAAEPAPRRSAGERPKLWVRGGGGDPRANI